MPDQGPVVMIGLQQIYDKIVTLEGTVARLVDQHDGVTREVTDHEARLRSLERGRWPLPALTIVIALLSLAVAGFAMLTR